MFSFLSWSLSQSSSFFLFSFINSHLRTQSRIVQYKPLSVQNLPHSVRNSPHSQIRTQKLYLYLHIRLFCRFKTFNTVTLKLKEILKGSSSFFNWCKTLFSFPWSLAFPWNIPINHYFSWIFMYSKDTTGAIYEDA